MQNAFPEQRDFSDPLSVPRRWVHLRARGSGGQACLSGATAPGHCPCAKPACPALVLRGKPLPGGRVRAATFVVSGTDWAEGKTGLWH